MTSLMCISALFARFGVTPTKRRVEAVQAERDRIQTETPDLPSDAVEAQLLRAIEDAAAVESGIEIGTQGDAQAA